MKLSMFAIVERTIRAREAIACNIDLVEQGKMGVTIFGTYQDDAIIAVAKPAVLAELKARIASLDKDLAAYGVSID